MKTVTTDILQATLDNCNGVLPEGLELKASAANGKTNLYLYRDGRRAKQLHRGIKKQCRDVAYFWWEMHYQVSNEQEPPPETLAEVTEDSTLAETMQALKLEHEQAKKDKRTTDAKWYRRAHIALTVLVDSQ